MTFLLGTDEAGYGPNLGPLVISATLWETPDGVDGERLFDHLAHLIASKTAEVRRDGPYVAMADSKLLYSPDRGLRHLERGLWAALGLLGHGPRTWRDVWHALTPESVEPMSHIAWYADHDEPAPLDGDGEDLAAAVEPLRAGLAAAGVRLIAVQSRAIFEEEFNALVERHDSKGAALSHETLGLAARLIVPLPAAPISVICDKHGGRNRYGSLLAEHFPDAFIEIHGEGRQRSVYRFGPAERRVEVCFRTKAESCLPAALASMASKYLRELAMRALNRFWQCRVPGLQPTAGYPQDARRFRVDIAEEVKRLGLAENAFWRAK